MSERQAHADTIVSQYATYTAAAGLIPMPVVDMAAVGGLQLKMIADMAKIYDIPFRRERTKAVISALVGGIGSVNLAYGVGGWTLRAIPLVGPWIGVLSTPLFAYATTYAIGKVFVQHFESGGTFLDFDPEKVRTYFRDQYDRARGRAAAGPAATETAAAV